MNRQRTKAFREPGDSKESTIELGEMSPAQNVGEPPDPRIVIDRLRRQLKEEREKRLNAVDALIGAEAAVAQAKAETQDVFYRLHVRETELEQLHELHKLHKKATSAEPELTEPSVTQAARRLAQAVKRSAAERTS